MKRIKYINPRLPNRVVAIQSSRTPLLPLLIGRYNGIELSFNPLSTILACPDKKEFLLKYFWSYFCSKLFGQTVLLQEKKKGRKSGCACERHVRADFLGERERKRERERERERERRG